MRVFHITFDVFVTSILSSMRSLVLSLLIFAGCATTVPPADPVRQLGADIDAILADSLFTHTLTCIKVVSLNSGKTLYERNSRLLVHPASNLKLFTSSTALQALGEAFRFRTDVLADSAVSDSVVHGNLYLKGYGDPDLSVTDLDSLAGLVHADGIKRVEGNIVGDVSYFDDNYWGNGWMWSDEPDPDEMFISPLCVNSNCITVTVTPTFAPGDSVIVTIQPPTNLFTVVSNARTVSDTMDYSLKVTRLYKDRPSTILVSGDIPLWCSPVKERISVRQPALLATTLFRQSLERSDVTVDGDARLSTTPPAARTIAEFARPIDSVIVHMNKTSDNLSAENLLKVVGAEKLGAPGTSENGLHIENQFLNSLGIDTTVCVPVDGSGVSHYNLITVEDIVRLLAAIARRPDPFRVIYTSLPVAGVDGTLASRMLHTAAQGNVHAKTGTIYGISSLSGYVTTKSNELLAFSIVMENFSAPTNAFQRAQDEICERLATLKKSRAAFSPQ